MSSDEGMWDPSGEEEEDSRWGCAAPKLGGKKLEQCLVGKQEIMLPEALTEQKRIFDEVMSVDTWKHALNPAQREYLMKFLPSFPEKDKEEKELTVKKLFSGENMKFGNPVQQFHTKLKGGFFSPDIARYSGMIKNVKYREYEFRQQKYYGDLLRDILLSRQKVLSQMKNLPQDERLKFDHKPPQPDPKEKTIEHRSRKKFYRLLKEVRQECGVEDTSSEEEEYTNPAQKSKKQLFKSLCPIPSPEPTIPSVVATYDVKPSLNGDLTSDEEHKGPSNAKYQRPISPIDVTEEDYSQLLKNHRRKHKECDIMECPELDIQNITLEEIMSRCQAHKKSPKIQPASTNSSMSLSKRKKLRMKERAEKKLKKEKDIRSEQSTPSRSNYTDEEGSGIGDTFFKTEIDNMSEYSLPESYRSNTIIAKQNNFFSLVRDLLIDFSDGKGSTAKIEEKVRELQESPSWSSMTWTKLETNWVDTVTSALKFLAGELIGAVPDNFVPFLDYKERAQQWTWIGAGRDSDDKLAQFFKHWMTNKKLTGTEEDGRDGSPPPPRSKTTFVVRATTEEEKGFFREQERRRFENPHKSFTYKLHGYESVVGPVKGVYTKESALNKAREHALLVSSRPAFVTILTLVRDASARLPNGEGTRGDICELLKDSQYLAPGVTDAQLNVVVSGALDRLHSEKDPCVKYDVNRKLWIYLHRNRTENEFERIHQAHGAAQKAKKSLAQTSKPKSSKAKLKDTASQQNASTATSLKTSVNNNPESLSSPQPMSSAVQSPKISNPLLNQSPRTSNVGARTVAAALKNATAANATQSSVNVTLPITTVASTRANQVTSANIMSSPTGATIRFQLQQYQLQQLQQQKQLQQKLQQVAAAQQASNAAKLAKSGNDMTSPQPTSVSQLKGENLLKQLPLSILQSLQASVADASSPVSQAITQSLASAIRPQLIQRQASSGSPVPQQSPAGTPTPGSPVPTRLHTPQSGVVTATSLSSLIQSSGAGAPLVARLVQQIGGNQMVNVSNLLAAQRAQNPNQGSLTNATLKIQGGNVMAGKPIHLTGKPRGQIVHIAGKGQQQMGLIQGALPTISIIPQAGGTGVMTLAQNKTPVSGGAAPIFMTAAGAKPGQNIQVVRTMLGQQAGLKPGQATLLISQPNLQQSGANIVSTGQIVHNTASVQGKAGAKNKTTPVYARIITPPAGMRLATVGAAAGQSNQNVGMIQTVNKFISTGNVSIATTHPGDGDHVIASTTSDNKEGNS
ncbi:nuclear factor related to kappa-B-binding protein-like isoform X2 [Mytilus californianus]|uniref:nuclear factor related to kappa-B-binding protein-like isoform X2 n=1 Tax=Mytilus californianus TaxID=6549 RepID=UPI00224817A7|nr:nuclear factor related to kappa-B-binding protein-like isoform X2 [Mytilus californianus]